MASFTIHVESILDIDTTENVLLIAKWIKDSMQKAGQSINEYNFKITFQIGDLRVECEDESEFREHSLGQVIDVRGFSMNFNITKSNSIFFYIYNKSAYWNEGKNVSVSSDDRLLILDVTEAMNHEKIWLESTKDIPSQGIVIQGNNNQIGVVNSGNNNQFEAISTGNNNSVYGHTQSPPSKEPAGFWRGVLQFIVSNIVWLTIVAIIIITITVLGITQPDWLRF